MADGDPWKLNRIACVYEDDSGNEFRFRAVERYQAQEDIGWVAVTDPKLRSAPKGLKPRRWLLWDAGPPAHHENRRSVVIATNAAYVAGVIGTTTLAVQNPSTDVEDTFTLYAMEGERLRGQEQD
jgi:hypothetical protein